MVSRGVELPTDVDAEGAKAGFKDRLPHLTVPKKSGRQNALLQPLVMSRIS
jgi:hypothetical protein